MGPRALPTNKGLDRRKLLQIVQELVQGVSMVRPDGVLVLEQELRGAREESQWQRGTERNRERRLVRTMRYQEGAAKFQRSGKDKQWRTSRTWIVSLLKKEKKGKGPGELCRGGCRGAR